MAYCPYFNVGHTDKCDSENHIDGRGSALNHSYKVAYCKKNEHKECRYNPDTRGNPNINNNAFCNSCGARNSSGSNFCSGCGSRI